MKKSKWFTMGIVLTLAVVMAWAAPGVAQMRGKGQGGQGCGQGQAQGYGQCQGNGTCPNYPGYQNRGKRRNNPQGNMGRRGSSQGGGRNDQPGAQPSAPPVTQ